MGKTEGVNVGRFIDEIQWHKPVVDKSPTGDIVKKWIPDMKVLCDVSDDAVNSERIDNALCGKSYLKFTTWRSEITIEWRVFFNGNLYDVDKIALLNRGLYAVYECSKDNL